MVIIASVSCLTHMLFVRYIGNKQWYLYIHELRMMSSFNVQVFHTFGHYATVTYQDSESSLVTFGAKLCLRPEMTDFS